MDENIYNFSIKVFEQTSSFQIFDVCLVGDIISCNLAALSHDFKDVLETVYLRLLCKSYGNYKQFLKICIIFFS